MLIIEGGDQTWLDILLLLIIQLTHHYYQLQAGGNVGLHNWECKSLFIVFLPISLIIQI